MNAISTEPGTRPRQSTANELPEGFTSETAQVNGVRLHYVRGGTGPTLLLVHGFPQDWYEWRCVMPRLARTFSVIAVDLRGVGGSDAPQGGSDAHYAQAYGDAAHLRAAFEVFRAVPANIAFNSSQQDAIDVPLLLAGGANVFGPELENIAANLRTNFGWSDVEVEVIADGQHYLVEEQPDDVLNLLEGLARRRCRTPAVR